MAKRSAMGLNSPLIKLAAVAGAYFLVADPVNLQVDKILTKVFPNKGADGVAIPGSVSNMGNWAGAAGEGVPGYMLLMKGRSSILKTAAGAILIAAAAKRAMKAAGVVSGYQAVPVIGSYQRVPVIGMTQPETGYGVNGVDNMGYRVNGRNQSVLGGVGGSKSEGSDLLT